MGSILDARCQRNRMEGDAGRAELIEFNPQSKGISDKHLASPVDGDCRRGYWAIVVLTCYFNPILYQSLVAVADTPLVFLSRFDHIQMTIDKSENYRKDGQEVKDLMEALPSELFSHSLSFLPPRSIAASSAFCQT